MYKTIQVTRSSLPSFEEYIDEIRDLWNSHWLTNMGVKHQQLEAELSRYLQTPQATLFTNGHLALEAALVAFELTGEVITTPFTFASTTHAIVRNGLEPVFCDIHPASYTLDVDKLERLITDRTSAIVPVHVYGQVCQVHEIERIARQYNLKVIYDAAHAFGVTVDGVGIANFGDAAVFSFHATKVFNTIEGGAVACREAQVIQKLNHLKNFGINGPEEVVAVGGNAKMSEFQAAMGLCNLRHIDAEIAKRQVVAERYYERLSDIEGLVLTRPQQGVKSNYAFFPVGFAGFKLTRDEVFASLKNQHIHARKYFYPLTNSFACYRDRFDVARTPVARGIAEQMLTLPLYADLALADVDRVCDIILA